MKKQNTAPAMYTTTNPERLLTNPDFTIISYRGTTVTWNGIASAVINTSRRTRFALVLRMLMA